MTSFQSSKQQQQHSRQGPTESIDHLFASTTTARFQANHRDQLSLRDMILRGNSAFPLITYPHFHETNRCQVNGGIGSGGNLSNLIRVLDDALLVSSDNYDQRTNQPPQ